MSNVSISMTGSDSAQINFCAKSEDGRLTAGNESQHTIEITDGHFLRRIAGEFFKLKNMEYDGTVAVKLGTAPRMILDPTLWRDLADALLAFTMNIDLTKQLGELMAA